MKKLLIFSSFPGTLWKRNKTMFKVEHAWALNTFSIHLGKHLSTKGGLSVCWLQHSESLTFLWFWLMAGWGLPSDSQRRPLSLPDVLLSSLPVLPVFLKVLVWYLFFANFGVLQNASFEFPDKLLGLSLILCPTHSFHSTQPHEALKETKNKTQGNHAIYQWQIIKISILQAALTLSSY